MGFILLAAMSVVVGAVIGGFCLDKHLLRKRMQRLHSREEFRCQDSGVLLAYTDCTGHYQACFQCQRWGQECQCQD